MTTAQWIFEQAMHLMDEGAQGTGKVDTVENRDHKNRVVPILNVLRVECFPYSDTWAVSAPGKRPVCPEITDLESEVGLDDGICQGVLPYGLAAHLLLEENPNLAGYFQQRYEEGLNALKRGSPTVSTDIADLYGGIEYGEFSRW